MGGSTDGPERAMSLLQELKRRNVFRAAAAYVAVAWLVIQVAETTFPAFGLSEQALRNLILVLAIGFIPAVVLSWTFELTPEGLKRDRDLAPGSELSRRTRRMLDRGIVIVLALGLAYFAFDKFILDPARDEALVEAARQEGRSEALVESYGDQSIAVLPFTNMSADPEQEYFGDGMAEEVLNLLARIPELRVISRSSAFTYKDKNLKLNEIAAELNVAHILEGSVRRAGNKIRVTAQLIEARSDTHLWSQTWDRELADIFAIQDEIAAEVVANLQLKLLGEVPRARRVDPEAYALYLQGRFLIESNDFQSLAPALEFMRSALEIDPDYARAWTGVAWVYYRYMSRQRAGPVPGAPVTFEEASRLYQEATEQALAIDPDDPAALSLKAWQFLRVTPDYAQAAYYFERALAAAPGEGAVLAGAASIAGQLGRKELSLRLMQASVDRDPMCNWCQWNLMDAYSALGRIEDADALMDRQKARGVNVPHGAELFYWLAKGDFAQARQVLSQVDPSRTYVPVMEAEILFSEGRTSEVRAIVEALDEGSAEEIAADISTIYARLGEYALALDWLEKEVAANGCRRLQLNVWSIQERLQSHRHDPRWLELARRCGVAPEDLARIQFDFTLPGE